MENRPTSAYIYIGTAIRYLVDVAPGDLVFVADHVSDNIYSLSIYLPTYEFWVTQRVMKSLLEMHSEWKAERLAHIDDPEWEKTRVLTPSEAHRVNAAAKIVRQTMLAEGDGKVAYIATDKRYTVELLVGGMSKLMSAGVYDLLPEFAKIDFAEAGKALAFDLPTASAFHILRGTESVVRDFYSRVVDEEWIAEPRMWKNMIDDLRKRTNAPPELLLDNLDSLRRHFRNPTQHPELIYDIDGVQDLLGLAIESVNRMVRYLIDEGR